MEARDYQIDCDEKTFAAFDAGAKGVLNALPTGAGKTAVAGLMARRMQSLLFVVDREELAFQSHKTLQLMTGKQVHLECGPDYKAFKTAPNAKFVVAMSQSMIKRKAAYSPDRFEYIIEDECFVAGTMVDGRPIESVKVGEMVFSFNHETGEKEIREVARTFSSYADHLVRIRLQGGIEFICTSGHPFWVSNGITEPRYESASKISASEMLRSEYGAWRRIVSVEKLPFGARVYNLEVEGNHNYFVNGFLVHNCHHSVSPTRTAIREYFSGKRGVIGFSATPTRADNKAAGLVYDTVAYQMSYLEAVDLGWLVPFKSRVVTCHDMDLREFKGTAEYSTKELRKQVEKQSVIEHIAKKTIAIADGRQTVLFAKTVQQSQQICNLLKSIGERATHVDGKMMRYMRRDRLEQFGLKNFQFVCNCGLIEEGVDVPGIEVVSMAAPMRSTGRFMQRVGRGSRATVQLTGKTPEERRAQIASSDKPHFTVIDFIGQMDEHSAAMCFSGDLLAGDFDDETRKVAMRMATGQNEGDIRAIVANAREVVKHRRRKLSPQEERAAARERYAKVERSREQVWAMKTTFHPFDVLELDRKLPDKEVSKSDQYGRTLDYSERYLKECHMTPQEINVLTNSQRVYLAKILRLRAETHAPWPQSRRIHACGYNAAELSKQEANELSNRITKAGFVRPSEDGPNQRYLAGQNGSPVSSSKDFIFL